MVNKHTWHSNILSKRWTSCCLQTVSFQTPTAERQMFPLVFITYKGNFFVIHLNRQAFMRLRKKKCIINTIKKLAARKLRSWTMLEKSVCSELFLIKISRIFSKNRYRCLGMHHDFLWDGKYRIFYRIRRNLFYEKKKVLKLESEYWWFHNVISLIYYEQS